MPHRSNESLHNFKADEQRRALDENGLRYLISLKSFLMVNQRSSEPAGERHFAEISTRERMRYRDFVWAFHSSCQEILLQAAVSSVGGKLIWKDAKALGIFLWLKSQEPIVRVCRYTSFKSQFRLAISDGRYRSKSVSSWRVSGSCFMHPVVFCSG